MIFGKNKPKSAMSAEELKIMMEIEKRDILVDFEKIKSRFSYLNLLSDLVKYSGLPEKLSALLSSENRQEK